MPRLGLWRLLLCAFAFALAPISVHGAERPAWADPKLPESPAPVVWLDASVQQAAARAAGPAELPSGDAFETWRDGSGHGRDVSQPVVEARPTLRIDGELASVRFSGHGAVMSRKDTGIAFDAATIFLVTAPLSNEGSFRGMLSMHAAGLDDFTSGINIDQGPFPSPSFQVVNIEGPGFSGFHQFRSGDSPFADWRRLCVVSQVGEKGVALYVDGRAEGVRARQSGQIRMDELVVGGRWYGGAEGPHGFFEGEIAEVLIYDRPLNDEERLAVDDYLAAKYKAAGPVPPRDVTSGGIPRVAAPPPVQIFVPGFSVRELPVELTNVNNVLYREDGVLVALGYDGNVHLLTDTDGDGLEDRDTLFWENAGQLRAPIGMALTPPGYERGRGVLVAAKGECLLLVDADGDDRAEQEIVVAEGWNELPHGVDALGVAFDPRDHAVLFGLGTTNFTDAYLLGKGDKPGYRLDGEHGTILRVATDFKSREIFATGIRFPVAIRFNGAGDLFCTDQEGATWLANGNPFDELLHVQRGRHYGFPPRHPRHLPQVIDEPSVFDYRPQHQSTCGLNFNEPATDGSIFGPDWWKGDAIVSGYSRGKLYRTKLAKTAAGHVAQNQLIGSVAMLPADACVGPERSLVIAAHSGGPDWGSGPSGKGRLFKATQHDPAAPVPSLVWAESPREVRIAFDRPVDAEALKDLVSRVAIEGGEFVAAGDRFELLRPGYAAVEHQQNAPRFGVEVQGVQLTADRRTLILTTAPQTAAGSYAIALPELKLAALVKGSERFVPQLPDVDLQYDLSGVETIWTPAAGGAEWKGWLPHPDLDVSRAFTTASVAHEQLWASLQQAGTLTLKTSLDLRDMLRPAVQIGSKIDYEWPPEEVTLTFTSHQPFGVTLDGQAAEANRSGSRTWTVEGIVGPSADGPAGEGDHSVEIQVRRQAGDAAPTLTVHYHTNEDPRPRALALHRFLVPWARRSNEAPEILDNRALPELAGGSWLRGRKEFFGSDAGCSKCHSVRGEGGAAAPDLSNLPMRDYPSVLRDISQPSFAINPDFVAQIVTTVDGLSHAGTLRTEGKQLIFSDQEGKETAIARADVEEVRPSELSIMPEGIPQKLGPERLRDLLTFLLVAPPSMPVYGELPPPPARTFDEVNKVLAGGETATSDAPLHVVLVSGPKDHGIGEHDYPAWQIAWKALLEMDDNVQVTTADPWPSADDLKSADVLVFYQQGSWTPERAVDIDRFLRRGGGLVYVHYAVDGGADPQGFADRIGLAWLGGRSKFRHGPLEVEFAKGGSHPIARNFAHVHFHDESYWNLVGDPGDVTLLATGKEDDAPQPLFWTHEPEIGGRVFVSIPGHFAWTFDDPLFRALLLRGIAWTAGQSVDRLNELVLPGARVETAKH